MTKQQLSSIMIRAGSLKRWAMLLRICGWLVIALLVITLVLMGSAAAIGEVGQFSLSFPMILGYLFVALSFFASGLLFSCVADSLYLQVDAVWDEAKARYDKEQAEKAKAKAERQAEKARQQAAQTANDPQ